MSTSCCGHGREHILSISGPRVISRGHQQRVPSARYEVHDSDVLLLRYDVVADQCPVLLPIGFVLDDEEPDRASPVVPAVQVDEQSGEVEAEQESFVRSDRS